MRFPKKGGGQWQGMAMLVVKLLQVRSTVSLSLSLFLSLWMGGCVANREKMWAMAFRIERTERSRRDRDKNGGDGIENA